MRSHCLRLFALLALSLCAFASPGDDALTLNRKVLDACFTQKWDEALTLLAQLDRLQPEYNGTAYNYACVYARKGEPDKAFEWLGRSIEWGWGGARGSVATPSLQATQSIWHAAMLETDADLESLRKDERFAKIVERAKALQKRAEEYTAEPALYVPEKLKDAAELPVLIVLHEAGGDKASTLAAWKPIADELVCALAVPAAPFSRGEDPARGWAWIDDPSNFAQPGRTKDYQQPVNAALDALRKTKKLAANRVWLAGAGQGATLALLTALHNATLVRGAAVLDPDVDLQQTGYKVPGAKAAGLRLEARFDPTYWKARGGADATQAIVAGWAFPGSCSALAEVKDAAARRAALAAAVRALAQAADDAGNATPAVAPK
ncbi:MAG: hypothetical protein IPJ19_11265 [Planctomycetes bacterium]|nr:hypothetical protein [Planctomycetota bacterium]